MAVRNEGERMAKSEVLREAKYPTLNMSIFHYEGQALPLQSLSVEIEADGAVLKLGEYGDGERKVRLNTEQAIQVAEILYYSLYPSLINARLDAKQAAQMPDWIFEGAEVCLITAACNSRDVADGGSFTSQNRTVERIDGDVVFFVGCNIGAKWPDLRRLRDKTNDIRPT